MKKNFELSLILGRFNHIHLGHKRIIDISKELSPETLVVIGSSQESGTLRNPFRTQTRKNLIKKLYENDSSIIISELEDMTHEYNINFDWGKYVLENVENMAGKRPDLIITGNDESRRGWFDPKDVEEISEMVISRKIVDISGTTLRGYMIINDRKMWTQYMPKELENYFDELRSELFEIPVYKKIYDQISDSLTIENFNKIYNKYEEEDRKEKLKMKK